MTRNPDLRTALENWQARVDKTKSQRQTVAKKLAASLDYANNYWRVLSDTGELAAYGFDTQAEAEQWIKDQQDD